MRIGVLFQLKGDKNIYRVADNPSKLCTNCCAVGKERLCKKMPYCYGEPPVFFERLSSYEVRQVKKTNQFVEYIEN